MQSTAATSSPTAPTVLTSKERFLAAMQCQPVDCTPVWFMRQAGRCLPDYRALRQSHDILELTRTPELCAQVTLMPVNALHVDAAVMYADIMLPLYALKLPFSIDPGVGPIIPNPVRTRADVDALAHDDPVTAVKELYTAMRIVRKELADRTALIGFAGGPFTLASYMIEGRPTKEFEHSKGMLLGDPALWHALMERIVEVTIPYLDAQIEAGADAIQIFDSWAGALSVADYHESVLPYTSQILSHLAAKGVPTIHFATMSAHLIEEFASTKATVLSCDWRLPLSNVARRVGRPMALQGNLDPAAVLTPRERLIPLVDRVLDDARQLPGHIFNLGHGVLASTPAENLAFIADYVHTTTRRAS